MERSALASELDAIRRRARVTREVIDGSNSRNNYTVESPALLDREALLRAIDAALAVGGDPVRDAVHAALQ
jgi:hypothetical protein